MCVTEWERGEHIKMGDESERERERGIYIQENLPLTPLMHVIGL